MCEMATPAHNKRSGFRSEMCEMATPAHNERSSFRSETCEMATLSHNERSGSPSPQRVLIQSLTPCNHIWEGSKRLEIISREETKLTKKLCANCEVTLAPLRGCPAAIMYHCFLHQALDSPAIISGSGMNC